MKRLLLVSTQYPTPGAGTRTAGLVKYLPRFGWDVSMISPWLPREIKAGPNVVETPAADPVAAIKARLGIRPGQSVAQRIGGPRGGTVKEAALASTVRAMKSVIAYPDERRGWIRPAVDAAKDLFSAPGSTPDAVLSSSPAVSGHVVAHYLARDWQAPWIADLRDLWSDNPYHRQIRMRQMLDLHLERRTLESAQALTTVSDELAAALRQRHHKHVVVITNGFDPEELRPDDSGTYPRFTITHTGGMYAGKRDPRCLLQAVRDLLDASELQQRDIEVDFFGPREVWLDRMIHEMNLEDVVKQNDYVNSRKSIAAQRKSHLLLLLTWDHPADSGTCPLKLFEYMAARRPILAIGYRESAGSRIVEQTGLGRAFSSADVAGVRGHLLRAVQQAATAEPQANLDPETASRYSQLEMARKFARLLDEATG